MINKILTRFNFAPLLDYTRYNEENLQEHYKKLKPCLDEIKKNDIDSGKFYKNHAYKHKKVVGEQHDPNANLLVDGATEGKIEAFQSTLELTTKKVNSLNWKELNGKELEVYYNQLATSKEKGPSFKDLSTGDIPGIWQTVSDCTHSMGNADLVIIDKLIVFSKLSEGAELLASIPISYKVGACIGFIRMVPIMGLYLQPGFSTDMLLMFKKTISGRVMYNTLMGSARVFVYNNSHVILYTTVASFVGIVGYSGAISHWPLAISSSVEQILSKAATAHAGYDLGNALGKPGADQVEGAIKAGEGILYTTGSAISRFLKAWYGGLNSMVDIIENISENAKKK